MPGIQDFVSVALEIPSFLHHFLLVEPRKIIHLWMLHLAVLRSLDAEELCISGFGAEVREPVLMTQGRCVDFSRNI